MATGQALLNGINAATSVTGGVDAALKQSQKTRIGNMLYIIDRDAREQAIHNSKEMRDVVAICKRELGEDNID